MTVKNYLIKAVTDLRGSSISSARLDSLILLEDATGKSRAWLLSHPEFTVQGETLYTLQQQIKRRAQHEPLAYIRGKSEFYGREFTVSSDTLQPRPETETMIELLLQQVKSKKLKVKSIVDVGTGSGCIAITTKLELPTTEVYATDISKASLKIAQQNAKNLQADVNFYEGNLLEPLPPSTFHLPPSEITILANLPYVPDAHTINQAAMHEPALAIFGGEDGLDYYRALFTQIKHLKIPVELLLTESLPPQHEQLETLANTHGYRCLQKQDFIQVFARKEKTQEVRF